MPLNLLHPTLTVVFACICLFSVRILLRHAHDGYRRGRPTNKLSVRQ